MPWKVEALVTGLISLRVGLNSKIGPEFRIDSARELGGGRGPTHQELEKRWENAIGRTKRNIARGHAARATAHHGDHRGNVCCNR